MGNPWDERYAGKTFMYGTEPNDFLREKAELLPRGARVLCLAEGEGRNAVYLAERGFAVTGVDASAVGLSKARALAEERGVAITTVVDDLSHHDLGDARWDGIVSIWCHVPPPLRASLHARITRALAPGGVLVLEHYHPRQTTYGTGGPPDPSLLVTLEELRRDFSSLEELHGVETEREVREGHGHLGMSAVTQFVARRR
jgi:SAM-dependent methyltransferase